MDDKKQYKGIVAQQGNGNKIYDNVIINCDVAIDISGSTNTEVWGNRIISTDDNVNELFAIFSSIEGFTPEHAKQLLAYLSDEQKRTGSFGLATILNWFKAHSFDLNFVASKFIDMGWAFMLAKLVA